MHTIILYNIISLKLQVIYLCSSSYNATITNARTAVGFGGGSTGLTVDSTKQQQAMRRSAVNRTKNVRHNTCSFCKSRKTCAIPNVISCLRNASINAATSSFNVAFSIQKCSNLRGSGSQRLKTEMDCKGIPLCPEPHNIGGNTAEAARLAL